MDAGDRRGVGLGQPRGRACPEVSSVRTVASESEVLAHEAIPQFVRGHGHRCHQRARKAR